MNNHIYIENRQRQHYAKVASTYTRSRASDSAKALQEYIDSFIPYKNFVNDTSTVLLLGCGSHLPVFAKHSTAFVVGLDLSFEMLQSLNSQHPQLPLVQGSGFSLPFQSQSIHLIVARGSLHHMPELSRIASQISHSLVVAGILLFLEPFNDWIVWRTIRSIIYSKSSQLDQFSEEALRYNSLNSALTANRLSILSMNTTGLATFLFLRNSDISLLARFLTSQPIIFAIAFSFTKFLDYIFHRLFSDHLWFFPELVGIVKKME